MSDSLISSPDSLIDPFILPEDTVTVDWMAADSTAGLRISDTSVKKFHMLNLVKRKNQNSLLNRPQHLNNAE
jgi:hypothetical protein